MCLPISWHVCTSKKAPVDNSWKKSKKKDHPCWVRSSKLDSMFHHRYRQFVDGGFLLNKAKPDTNFHFLLVCFLVNLRLYISMSLYLPYLFVPNNMHLYSCADAFSGFSQCISLYTATSLAMTVWISSSPHCYLHNSSRACTHLISQFHCYVYMVIYMDGHSHRNRKDVHVEFQVTN